MKKLITIFFIFFTAFTYAQIATIKVQGSGGGITTAVDSIWRTLGQDSIKFSINGRLRSIKDSTGGGGGTALANFYLKDSTLSGNRTVNMNGNRFSFLQGTYLPLMIDPANDTMAFRLVHSGGGQSLVKIGDNGSTPRVLLESNDVVGGELAQVTVQGGVTINGQSTSTNVRYQDNFTTSGMTRTLNNISTGTSSNIQQQYETGDHPLIQLTSNGVSDNGEISIRDTGININTPALWINGVLYGSSGGNTIYTGDGFLPSDRNIYLDSNLISFSNNGNGLLNVSSTVGNEYAFLKAISTDIPGASSNISVVSNNSDGYTFNINAGNNTNTVSIAGDAVANAITHTAATHTINGSIIYNTPPTGTSTDSILTWDATSKIVNKRPSSSFGSGTVTSVATGLGLSGGTITTTGTLLVDTSSASILSRQRAAATYALIGNYAIADSTLWQTKFRSDSARNNLYTSLAGKQASGNYAIADSTLWQTKFRTDSARTNIYSSLAGKGRVDSIRLVNTGVLHTTPAAFALSGNTGVVTQTLATQTANTVFSGPTSGGAATPTFRALVAADIPSLSGTYLPLAGGTMVGNILATDNTYDLGASGATRFRTGYFGTSLVSPLFNGLAITNNGTNTLNIAAGKTLTISNTMTVAGTDAMTYTMPDSTATLSRMPLSATTSAADTTTLDTQKPITGLTLWAKANKKYKVTIVLGTGCDNTGGLRFAINGPASSAIKVANIIGTGTSNTALSVFKLPTMGTLSTGGAAAFQRVNAQTGSVTITAFITTAGTAGAVYIGWAVTTLAQTGTILSGATFDMVEEL